MKNRIFNILRELWKFKGLEKYLVKITSNRIYGTLLTKLPPNHYQYKTGSIRKVQRRGIEYELDISDVMGWHVYFDFQEISKSNLYSLLNTSDIVFDVGANIGETTLNFAKILGKKGKVHSFEPDPINHIFLKKNVGLNPFENILLNQLGIGNESGTFRIHTFDKNNKGMNRIVSNTVDIDEYREIMVTTIDKYVEENNIQKVDLIKIDIEGYEFNALKGASKVLNKFRPKLFIELDNQNLNAQGSSAKELVTHLIGIGYNVFHAETGEKITSGLNFSHCHYDIIAKINL